ncbi:hypothetical protein ATANTOWER_002275 [Ataeniobius toweri]|uniref:Peptidase S8 pro-domain domain-containing protein n=1 Tax=Ataeniobius toweri TaxID=208326 RepID=A0ABU7C5B8_9TELE|nr:hypothetical protein [Ataeniobius toweri]
MRGYSRYGTAVGFMVLLNALLIFATQATGVLTDHLLVQLHEDAQGEAHQVATQHGFQSARKLPFGDGLFHFYPQETSKRRSKRSARIKQRLQKDRRLVSIVGGGKSGGPAADNHLTSLITVVRGANENKCEPLHRANAANGSETAWTWTGLHSRC